MTRCPRCKSADVVWLGFYQTWIALDDAVDWNQYECHACGHGWDE